MKRARRQRLRGLQKPARRALIALRLWLVVIGATCTGFAQADILSARFADETTRYPHGVLGDTTEFGSLVLTLDTSETVKYTLPADRVFEDLAPRLADLDGDGQSEVIVVESDLSRGARLAIYDQSGLVTATPFIGTRFRWLAPIGAADLDGDGAIEIAYIDRPHLAKTLRIWRYENRSLSPVADLAGLTNHRIGEDFITGGVRDCGGGPELITVNANWSRVMASTLSSGQIATREIGPFAGGDSIPTALNCQ